MKTPIEKDWEVVRTQLGQCAGPFKRARTEPLFSGDHNQFHLQHGELPAVPLTAESLQQALHEIRAGLPGTYITPVAAATSESHPFVDAMLPAALEARTENGALTYASSGSALLDFFFQIVETSTCEDVHALLPKAWQEAPLETLQCVAQLRDIRHGKAERARAHDALIWLAQRHPRTLLANLPEVVKVGYYKDLLEIAARLAVGEAAHAQRVEAAAWRMEHKGCNHATRKAAKHARLRAWRAALAELEGADKDAARAERAAFFAGRPPDTLVSKLLQAQVRNTKARIMARVQRHAKQLASVERARHLFEADPTYRALHLSVALLYAAHLQRDLAALHAGKRSSSLAAKWAPTPKASHDRATLLASTIAELLFPESLFRPGGMPYEEYVETARRQYQKQYLVPLRRAAQCPEVFMSAKRWGEINYERVPSVCMRLNKKNFEYWDKERFAAFLGRVKTGAAKINAGALKPHDLVHEAMRAAKGRFDEDAGAQSSEASLEVMDAQWRAYVEQLRGSGQLSSAMAIADVSGSMNGQPLLVAIALSLLTAEVTAPPFNRLVCTFSMRPELHLLQGSTLVEKVKEVAGLGWDCNTDFNAVFDLLLKRALQAKLRPEDMVKTLFVFSDMEFDHAKDCRYYDDREDEPDEATNFQVVKAKFEAAGYKLPQIVFWNLRPGDASSQKSTPVMLHESGAALVSGFSGHLLKLFMDNGGAVEAWQKELTPAKLLHKALKGQGRYEGWHVVD